MSMTTANPRAPNAEMNVTPRIDVLLVLLIIFMVMTPLTPRGLDALVPPDKSTPPHATTPRTVIVQVLNGGGDTSLKINGENVSWGNIEARLREIFASRAERIVFIKGDDAVDFEKVADLVDAAHNAGIDRVGLLTAKI
jgi:biopolymer transport protein TolR